MKIFRNRKAAFTFTEIMIVVGIIGLLATMAIPRFLKNRATAQQNTCRNNLRQLESAKQQWAFEKKCSSDEAVVETELFKYLKQEAMPKCPASGNYIFGTVLDNITCDVQGDTPHTLDSL